ncbi:PHLOEM PROTEIN 2-LIKE A10-like protein [Drosera capensis]
MDTQLISRGSKLAQMRKKWFFILAAVGFSGYGACKVYNLLPSVDSKRRRLIKLISALFSVLDALAESAEAAGVVTEDLKDFLGSQSDEIPCSLRQVLKIAKSDEFVDSVSRITQAVTAGTLKGYGGDSDVEGRVGDGMGSGFNDRFFDKLFSDSGSGFASVVVGNFARNVVMAMYAGMKTHRELIDSSDDPGSYVLDEGSVPKWVDLMCSDRSRALVGGCIQVFVSTAVTVYLEKTMHINPYNDFFAGATNPNHEEKVKDMVVSVCDRAVETMIKTSHKVLTKPETTRDSAHPPTLLSGEENSDSHADQGQSSLEVEQNGYQHMPLLDAPRWKDGPDAHKPSGWLSEVSSTLLVPRNRSFILDVTGRVTFETVRSFLEFLRQTLLNGIKSCYNLVHNIVANTWVEVTSYVSVNSLAVMTIFLFLFVHIFLGAWLLMLD